jgi:hypothetical protein
LEDTFHSIFKQLYSLIFTSVTLHNCLKYLIIFKTVLLIYLDTRKEILLLTLSFNFTIKELLAFKELEKFKKLVLVLVIPRYIYNTECIKIDLGYSKLPTVCVPIFPRQSFLGVLVHTMSAPCY